MYTYDCGSPKWAPLIAYTGDIQVPLGDKDRGSHSQGITTRFLFNSVPLSGPGLPLAFPAEWVSRPCSMEDGEKEDRDKEEQVEALWAEVTKKKSRWHGSRVEKPEAFMANFFKGLEIYQTKLLVSVAALRHSGCRCWPRQTSEKCVAIWIAMLPRPAHSSAFSLLISLPILFVLEENKKKTKKRRASAPMPDNRHPL